jgi:hypothetical protein
MLRHPAAPGTSGIPGRRWSVGSASRPVLRAPGTQGPTLRRPPEWFIRHRPQALPGGEGQGPAANGLPCTSGGLPDGPHEDRRPLRACAPRPNHSAEGRAGLPRRYPAVRNRATFAFQGAQLTTPARPCVPCACFPPGVTPHSPAGDGACLMHAPRFRKPPSPREAEGPASFSNLTPSRKKSVIPAFAGMTALLVDEVTMGGIG